MAGAGPTDHEPDVSEDTDAADASFSSTPQARGRRLVHPSLGQPRKNVFSKNPYQTVA